MTPLKARMASLLTRRFATVATLVTLAGGAAGGAAFAAINGLAAAPAAQAMATTSPASPAPSSKGSATSRHGHQRALVVALVRATAKETGFSLKAIRQDLRSGQTIDQIAGSSAGAVAHDVVAGIQARLDKRVAGGTMTKAQETSRLATATTRIQTLMSAKLGHGTSK